MHVQAGIEQQRELGQWIHRRYVREFAYLPAAFDPAAIRIQSTWYNRTRESALHNFRGLYGEHMDYEALNIFSVPEDQPDVVGLPYVNCAYAAKLAKFAMRSPEFRAFLSKHKVSDLPVMTEKSL